MSVVVDTIGAYRACFRVRTEVQGADGLTAASVLVLEDLAAFCCANESTAAPEAMLMAIREGRRQVWLHIQQKLNLTDAQVDRIANPPEPEDVI